jgi:hypothetical protein
MALTGQGGQFGGPQYGWGGVPNDPSAGARSGSAGSRTNFNSGLNDGRHTASPEAGMRRGAWQWSGHGPSAQRDYGWDYQGGVGRDEITMRTEARDGGSYLSHMAQDRSGGLPRYSQDYDVGDRWFPRLGERAGGRYAQDYDRGMRGGMGGGYDRGYQARGGYLGGSGNRQGYGGDYRGRMGGGHEEVTYGFGPRQGGGYGRDYGARQGGGYGRDFGQGRALGGGYGQDYNTRPLTDEEFYSRVNRW